jgi:hypothetical protein
VAVNEEVEYVLVFECAADQSPAEILGGFWQFGVS